MGKYGRGWLAGAGLAWYGQGMGRPRELSCIGFRCSLFFFCFLSFFSPSDVSHLRCRLRHGEAKGRCPPSSSSAGERRVGRRGKRFDDYEANYYLRYDGRLLETLLDGTSRTIPQIPTIVRRVWRGGESANAPKMDSKREEEEKRMNGRHQVSESFSKSIGTNGQLKNSPQAEVGADPPPSHFFLQDSQDSQDSYAILDLRARVQYQWESVSVQDRFGFTGYL